MEHHILAKEPDQNSPLYDLTIILGKPPIDLFLTEEGWWKFFRPINSILIWSQHQASISSGQIFSPTYKFVKSLKNLAWNEKNNRKLASQYLSEGNKMENLGSLKTGIICPSWKKCEELKILPDFIIKVENNPVLNDQRFSFAFMIAVKKELLLNDKKVLLTNFIDQISQLMNAVLIVQKERFFRFRHLSGGYTDTLQDIFATNIVNDNPNLADALEEKDWNISLKP